MASLPKLSATVLPVDHSTAAMRSRWVPSQSAKTRPASRRTPSAARLGMGREWMRLSYPAEFTTLAFTPRGPPGPLGTSGWAAASPPSALGCSATP